MINIIKGFLKLISLLSLLFFYSMTFAQEGYDWKEPVFMENNAGNEAPNHSIIDASGNVYFSGLFKDEINIQDTVLYSSMETGVYLSKYDNDHNHLWSKLILESKEVNPNQFSAVSSIKLEKDLDDDIYVFIVYSDTIINEGVQYTVNQSNVYYLDQIILKYDYTGALLNRDHIKGDCSSGISNYEFFQEEIFYTLTVSKSNLETKDSCICIINSDTTKLAFKNQAIIGKMNEIDRIPIWQKVFKANGAPIGVYFFKIVESSMYLTGRLSSSSKLEFDNDELNVPWTYNNYIYVMKLDLAGNKKWWNYAGVINWDSFLQLVDFEVNTDNDIVLSLNHSSQTHLNQIHFSDFSSLQGFGNNDRSFAVVNYDSLGNIKWKDISDSRGYETNGGLATDSEHNVYLTSTYIDSLYSENIWYDQLITSYTKDGQKRWSTTISGLGTERGGAIFFDMEDNMHLLSSISGSEIRLGGTIDKSVPSGSSFFLVKLEKQPLSTNAFSISENDIKVYPNPNTGSFFIESDVNTEIRRIEIYNALGQFVQGKQSPDAITKVYNLKNGLYLVKVKTENGEVVKKIIVE